MSEPERLEPSDELDSLDDEEHDAGRAGDPAATLAAARDALSRGTAPGSLAERVLVHARACRAATRLGRLDEALESGLLAHHLADCDPARTAEVPLLRATEALADAMVWRGQGAAAVALVERLRAAPPPAVRAEARLAAGWQLHLALLLGETLAWRHAIGEDGHDTLLPRAGLQGALDTAHATAGLWPVSARSALRLGWLQALLHCSAGEPERARLQLASLRPLQPAHRADLELPTIWIAMLIAQAQDDPSALEEAARRLADEAHRLGHQPLSDLAEQRLARCLAAQGRELEARQRVELAARRRLGTEATPLPTSARLSRYLAQVRSKERRPALQPETETGPGEDLPAAVPSRPDFLARARQVLPRAADGHLAVLLLAACEADPSDGPPDERVLDAFARLIGRTLRAGDLAAHWSGSQVAVLLPEASADDAARICQRIAQAVQARDWSTLSGDHRLQIDISHAQAGPGDTIEALMQRCEAEMAAGRRRRARIAA